MCIGKVGKVANWGGWDGYNMWELWRSIIAYMDDWEFVDGPLEAEIDTYLWV